MPYLILIFGLLLGIYALYRFMLKASIAEIKTLIISIAVFTLCIALFFLAITGRLPAAIAVVSALIPLAYGYGRKWLSGKMAGEAQSKSTQQNPMTRDEAYEILGLQDGATRKDIQDAYKRLMKKVHPDQEGSEWMAAKLNAAKDLLLKS